eukprot:2194011-Amphidinium_carterae.1
MVFETSLGFFAGFIPQALSPKQQVERGIESGTYKLPDPPQLARELIGRGSAQENVKKYIQRSVKKQGMRDGKFPVLGSSGVKGIGKTALLLDGVHNIVPGLEGDAVQPVKAKASYMTFNGGFESNTANFTAALQAQPEPRSHGNAFGQTILMRAQVEKQLASKLDLSEALGLYRKLLGIDEAASLVFFIDEVGMLPDEMGQELVSALMSAMDANDGKLVFIFTHISQDWLRKQETRSGRQVIALELAALPLSAWKDSVPEAEQVSLRKAVKDHAGVHQLCLSCCGHPRALYDGLREALEHVPQFLDGAEADLIRARDRIMQECKFRELDSAAIEKRITSWFDFLQADDEAELTLSGVLLKAKLGPTDDSLTDTFFVPLIMQDWAQKGRTSLQHHLHHCYASDAVLGPDAKKKMEPLMYHYEAVLRLALAGKAFKLEDFYKTPHMAASWKDTVVTAPLGPGRQVVEVDNFKAATVKGHLENGFIVVSKAHSECGLEYLTPFRKHPDNELLVASVQCKFTPTAEWYKWRTVMKKAMKDLSDNGITTSFPVYYTAVDQTDVQNDTYKDGVYYIQDDLFDYTKRLGILRLHTEKLGKFTAAKRKYLSRAGSTDLPE